jgi:hypothetical protein
MFKSGTQWGASRMKQRTTNNNKNENMKMRKKLITALVLGACVGTQAFAQNTKIDTITFALTVQGQSSVSTSTAINAGNWSAPPNHYKTATKKLTQADIIQAISFGEYGNPGFYSSKATLMLVQGELSGFFVITPDLADSFANHSYVTDLTGPDGDILDGTFDTWADSYDSTSISWGDYTFVMLGTGRHFETNPINGNFPPGHMQPWGQIFVKDPANNHVSGTTAVNPVCDNVTFFFNLTVQECYDCYYLNSFISDSTFTFKEGQQAGNPCCTTAVNLTGKGTDKYYLTLSFDNTVNNHYLNYEITRCDDYNWFYTGWDGWTADLTDYGYAPDGLNPDSLDYIDVIRSAVGKAYNYECRFTLNGIMTYSWTLTFVNKGDAYADFVGTGKYDANGYGFIALDCCLLTGTANFTEKVVKDTGCCDDFPWYGDSVTGSTWYGPGDRYGYGGWYDHDPITESPFNPGPALTYHNDEDWYIWSWPRPYCNNN